MSLIRYAAAICSLALAFLFVPAGDVSAQAVPLSCTVTISDIAFGSYDTLPGSSVPSNGVLSVSCLNIAATTGTLYLCISLANRSMVGASSGTGLAYEIYAPGSATAALSSVTQIPIPIAPLHLQQTYTTNVQALIFAAQQTKPADSYSQIVTGTASYGLTSCTTGLANVTSFSFRTTATILKSCSVSASNLAFGSVTSLATIVDGQSALSVLCSNGTGYTIALNGGLSGASNPIARKMVAGAESITYGLYQNSGRTVPWDTTAPLAGSGTAETQTISVYGRVLPQATPSAGTYSDTIIATVTY